MHVVHQESFAPSSEDRPEDRIFLHRRTSRQSNSRCVIFVHGLGGDRYATWGRFPELLFRHFPRMDVAMYGYPSGLKRWKGWKWTAPDLKSEARILADQVRALGGYDALFFIAHSMGGLICQGAIKDLHVHQRKQLRRVVGLMMAATPQLGTRWLSFPLLKPLSPELRALAPHSPYIREVQEVLSGLDLKAVGDPRRPSRVHTWTIAAAHDVWVDRLSAEIRLPRIQSTLLPGRHTDVVKPRDENADSYRFVAQAVSDTLFRAERASGSRADFERQRSRPARDEELPELLAFAAREIGVPGITSDLAQVRAWHNKLGDPFWVVRRDPPSPREAPVLVGYFSVLALKEPTYHAVREGRLSILGVGEEHLADKGQAPGCYYVGGIAGTDRIARACVVERLMAWMESRTAGTAVPIVTRPVTEAGLRIAKQNGFQPSIPGKEGIGAIYERLGTP